MSASKRNGLRKRVAGCPSNRAGQRRYPDELREDVVAYCTARMSAGCTREAAARELGLSADTLWYWLRGARVADLPARPRTKTSRRGKAQRRKTSPSRAAPAVLRPVAVTSPPAPASPPAANTRVVVALPGGVRIEGLDVIEAVDVARRLSC